MSAQNKRYVQSANRKRTSNGVIEAIKCVFQNRSIILITTQLMVETANVKCRYD